jgi:hypothetical protein
MVRAMKMSNFRKGLGNCSHLTFVLISDDCDVACVDGRMKFNNRYDPSGGYLKSDITLMEVIEKS